MSAAFRTQFLGKREKDAVGVRDSVRAIDHVVT